MLSAQDTILLYDGSFDGFLTCVFEIYDSKLDYVDIQPASLAQESLFGMSQHITTDPRKADRVWKAIKEKTSASGSSQIYYTFLSEKEKSENLLLHYIRYALKSVRPIDTDFANPVVLKVSQIAKNVSREKHRMEAFVRFKLTKDGIYFANIEPDFNVLPIIKKHFTRRYADQKWIIYDMHRHYGLFYDLDKIDIVNLHLPDNFDATKTSDQFFALEELEFQTLWKDYFTSTNIKSRKNMRLHIQHVPKRYWKYLSEKTS